MKKICTCGSRCSTSKWFLFVTVGLPHQSSPGQFFCTKKCRDRIYQRIGEMIGAGWPPPQKMKRGEAKAYLLETSQQEQLTAKVLHAAQAQSVACESSSAAWKNNSCSVTNVEFARTVESNRIAATNSASDALDAFLNSLEE